MNNVSHGVMKTFSEKHNHVGTLLLLEQVFNYHSHEMTTTSRMLSGTNF